MNYYRSVIVVINMRTNYMRAGKFMHQIVHHLNAPSCYAEKLLGGVNFATLANITNLRECHHVERKDF